MLAAIKRTTKANTRPVGSRMIGNEIWRDFIGRNVHSMMILVLRDVVKRARGRAINRQVAQVNEHVTQGGHSRNVRGVSQGHMV